MITHHEIRLARFEDAPQIAEMSRDLIEHGMAWRWTPGSIQACIRSRTTNVAVAPAEHGIAGFAIMQYKDDEAHLSLLAVHPAHRRKRIGAALMAWHEAAALTAGIGTIYLESRAQPRPSHSVARRQPGPDGRAPYRKVSLDPGRDRAGQSVCRASLVGPATGAASRMGRQCRSRADSRGALPRGSTMVRPRSGNDHARRASLDAAQGASCARCLTRNKKGAAGLSAR